MLNILINSDNNWDLARAKALKETFDRESFPSVIVEDFKDCNFNDTGLILGHTWTSVKQGVATAERGKTVTRYGGLVNNVGDSQRIENTLDSLCSFKFVGPTPEYSMKEGLRYLASGDPITDYCKEIQGDRKVSYDGPICVVTRELDLYTKSFLDNFICIYPHPDRPREVIESLISCRMVVTDVKDVADAASWFVKKCIFTNHHCPIQTPLSGKGLVCFPLDPRISIQHVYENPKSDITRYLIGDGNAGFKMINLIQQALKDKGR